MNIESDTFTWVSEDHGLRCVCVLFRSPERKEKAPRLQKLHRDSTVEACDSYALHTVIRILAWRIRTSLQRLTG